MSFQTGLKSFVYGLGGSLAALGSFVLYRYLRWLHSPLRKLPGPSSRDSVFGCFPQIRREAFMEPHKKWWKEAGRDVPAISYTLFVFRPAVFLLDKDMVRTVLTAPYGKSESRFYKLIRLVADVLGDGLVTLHDEQWMRHRRIIQPAFKTGFLKESLDEAIPDRVNRFIGHWSKGVDQEIDVSSHLSALTLDIIGDVAFSHDFKGLESVATWAEASIEESKMSESDIKDPFIVYLSKSLRFNFVTIICSLTQLTVLNRYINIPLIRNRRLMNQAVDRVVADAKQENTKARSLLHLMIQAQDPERNRGDKGALTDSEVRDEVKTFMIAGHETTSTWLYWAFYAMAKFPDVQQKLYDDIIGIAPIATVERVQSKHVERMSYLNAFLNEVLRLFPPVGFFPRVNRQVEDLGKGVLLPAGTRIAIAPHLLHRHPAYWDNPDAFLPERWLNVSDAEVERRRFAFLPFSFGGRNCIGQRFATIEAQLILAPIVRQFRVQIASSQRNVDFKFTTAVTMKTKPRMKISIQKR